MRAKFALFFFLLSAKISFFNVSIGKKNSTFRTEAFKNIQLIEAYSNEEAFHLNKENCISPKKKKKTKPKCQKRCNKGKFKDHKYAQDESFLYDCDEVNQLEAEDVLNENKNTDAIRTDVDLSAKYLTQGKIGNETMTIALKRNQVNGFIFA